MKRIAVLTSGGDAPGMNAAVRAVVRAALNKDYEVFGVRNGYAGLMEGDFLPLSSRAVAGVLREGGTFLGSSRSAEFETADGQKKALGQLGRRGIGGLVVIGGNGTQSGSHALSQSGLAVVGIASTIDNDLPGTDISLGVDTALNVALESIDRLKTTSASHERAALIEVMGRECGYLALASGIAGGAEAIVIPEAEIRPDDLAERIRLAHERGKRYALVVVAEGARPNARALQEHFVRHRDRLGFELRVTVLGHVQRGGTPTAFDRLLGSRFGVAAVDQLSEGRSGVLIGLLKGEVAATPLEEIAGKLKSPDPKLLEMAGLLET